MVNVKLLSFNKKKNSPRRLFFLTLTLLFIFIFSYFTAFRLLGIDRDYFQYKQFFDSLSLDYDGRFELGFVWLSLLIKNFGWPFCVLLFTTAYISLSAKFYLIAKLPNKFFWIGVYFLILLPLHEMTQLRVAIALGFGYLAIYFSINESLSVRVTVLAVLSVLFHWTLLVFVPFVVFSRFLKRRRVSLLILIAFGPVVFIYFSFSFLSYLNPQVPAIVNAASEMQANPFSARNIIFLSIVAIGLANINRIQSDQLPWFYLSFFGIFFWYGMMYIPVFAHRVFELTIFSYFLWIPSLPKFSRLLAMILISLIAIYLFVSVIYLEPIFRHDL
ncbi:EpsG family protein [Vreelandella arcis]|uniref:EpsG family protein n=1 Tax=Vreelandella arcis TaxID=416873 RepID=A0A1H0IBY7_9GAMM|nr:EpsG family protein [Halomonas arcis]SDO28876.1 EpsG family protein [Halomonas arcis]